MKIFITGDSGAGKSTAAKTLHDNLNIPVFHTDAMTYKDIATRYPYNEFKEKIHSIISSNESYIIDGASFGEDPELFITLVHDADIVLFFDVPAKLAINGFIKRNQDFEKGIKPIGLNSDNPLFATAEFYKIWLEWYAKFMDVKEERLKILAGLPRKKTLIVRNYSDVDTAVIKITNGSFKKAKKK